MTLSTQACKDNYQLALRIMRAQIGDEIDLKTIQPDDPEFAEIKHTTWASLKHDRLLEGDRKRYFRLTAHGWLKCQLCCDEDELQKLKKKTGTLSKALKDQLPSDRSEEIDVHIGKIAEAAKLPEDWVRNAIESQLLEEVLRRIGPRWMTSTGQDGYIRVPLNFGRRLP